MKRVVLSGPLFLIAVSGPRTRMVMPPGICLDSVFHQILFGSSSLCFEGTNS